MAKITITVKNIDGAALSGANVTYGVNGAPVTGTTDANGVYTASGLPAKSYAFTASINGYVAQTEGIVLADNDEKTIDFSMAAQNATISAVEQAFTGIVTTAEEQEKETSWAEVYSDAKNALSDLSAGIDKGVALSEIRPLIGKAEDAAYVQVEVHVNALMIKRHTLPFWKCVGIDFEMLLIEAAKLYISIEVNKLLAKAKAKYTV